MRKLMMAAVAMSLVSTVAVAKDTSKKTTTTTETTKDSQPTTTTTSTDKQEQKAGPVNKEPHSVEIKDQGKSGTTLPPLGK